MHKFMVICICSVIAYWASLPASALSLALVVWRGETDAEKSFVQSLKLAGHQVDVTLYDAGQNKKKLADLIRTQLVRDLDEYDYVYSFGTTVSKAIKLSLKGRKPHIFNIVSYPAGAGIVPSEEGGQHNTAGVSSRVLAEDQIKSARKVIDLKKVAVAFNPREENSSLQLEKMVALGKQYQFEVIPIRIRPDKHVYLSDLNKITQIKELSAVYFPSDSFLISHAKEVMALVNENKIPSICAVSAYIRQGCLMGTVASYNTLGKLAASIVNEHIEGKALKDIPVKFDTNPQPMINEKTRLLLQL